MSATPLLASCRHLPMLPGSTASVRGTGASVLLLLVLRGLGVPLSLHQRKRYLRRGIHPTPFGQVEAINPYFSAVNRRMYWGICDLDTP